MMNNKNLGFLYKCPFAPMKGASSWTRLFLDWWDSLVSATAEYCLKMLKVWSILMVWHLACYLFKWTFTCIARQHVFITMWNYWFSHFSIRRSLRTAMDSSQDLVRWLFGINLAQSQKAQFPAKHDWMITGHTKKQRFLPDMEKQWNTYLGLKQKIWRSLA